MRFGLKLRRRRVLSLALAACSLALVAPVGASAAYDLHPRADEASPTSVDLRSPDAREAALAAAQASGPVDLRSPDTRDAARAAANGTATSPAPVVPAQPTVVPVVERGSQTLAIVFSSTALFLALLAIAFVAIYRRPRPRWTAS
jgi:hypothetical protein